MCSLLQRHKKSNIHYILESISILHTALQLAVKRDVNLKVNLTEIIAHMAPQRHVCE